MFYFLKLVGAFLLALLVLIVVGFYLIKWKLKSWFADVMAKAMEASATQIPPFRIRLRRSEPDEDDEKSEEVEQNTAELLRLGFTQIGDFEADEMPLTMRAFQHHEHRMYAVIYEHFVAGVWVDLVRRYKDKSGWTFTPREDDLADRPDYSNTKFAPESSVADLLEELVAESPSEGLLPAGADSFVKTFESAYAREMNWRIERGGTTEAEIRRIAEKDGTEVSDEDVQRIREKWLCAISDFLSERMLRTWAKENGLPPDDVPYNQIGVHKRMTASRILAALDDEYYEGAEDEDTSDEEDDPEISKWRTQLSSIREQLNQTDAIRVFRLQLKEMDLEGELTKLGEVSRPIRGEIWQRPDEDLEGYGEGMDEEELDSLDV